MPATAPTNDINLVLPTALEGSWQTCETATETITIGDYTATLTPEGKGAKRNYSLARRGKQIETGTFTRTPRKAMNKLLHQLHFAALPTGLLNDWRTALKKVLRDREEARWTDTHGGTWRRWQAVLSSLESRTITEKILEDYKITEVDNQSMFVITVRSGNNNSNLSLRRWTVTAWAPLIKETNTTLYPELLAPLSVTRIHIQTTSSDGTGDHHYDLDADTDWGGRLARALTRVAGQLSLYLAAVDAHTLSP
ncbi:hypothetical protein [Nocardia pseudovaccinii]|uniref:hypothetical protein n=1 Tax=Nocardia pseudovaccinii TaxID=189540 RepID=UPI0007A39938|nr:hypothetical protein [Nocardia pseudovaccinii]